MLVKAECLVKSWDSNAALMYEPGACEIDTENKALLSMVTVGGKYVFQYPGHTGGPAKPGTAPVQAPPVAVHKPRKADNRKGPMSAERKEKMRASLKAAREAKRARLEAAVA